MYFTNNIFGNYCNKKVLCSLKQMATKLTISFGSRHTLNHGKTLIFNDGWFVLIKQVKINMQF